MTTLCFSTFAVALQAALQEPNTNEDVVQLLLEWTTHLPGVANKNGEALVITSKMVSQLFGRTDNVRRTIKSVLSSKSNAPKAAEHFESNVIPFLIASLIDDLIASLRNIIEADNTIAVEMKKTLLEEASADSLCSFLVNTFLYAVQKPNKQITTLSRNVNIEISSELVPFRPASASPSEYDSYLLAEAGAVCPQCGKPLMRSKDAKSIGGYNITRIYPLQPTEEQMAELSDIAIPGNNPESMQNKIVLCLNCHNDYISAITRDDCLRLTNVKQRLVRNYSALETVDKMYLDDQIAEIVWKIAGATKEQLSDSLNYSAVRVSEKITSENMPLVTKTEIYVVQYYKYIENLFSQAEREGRLKFDDVAMEVQICCNRLIADGLTQEEVCAHLVGWIKNKTNVQSDTACDVVVAFFIQNCEVFHAIAQ